MNRARSSRNLTGLHEVNENERPVLRKPLVEVGSLLACDLSRVTVSACVKEETEAMDWEQTDPDFDANDDPDLSGEYCKDIFKNEITREIKWVFPRRITDKKSRLRVSCVDWLTEVSFTWNLATDTLFVAVLYFDKVLRAVEWTLDDLQPLAGTCLLIAAKMEEVHAIPIGDIIDITPGTNLEMIKSYEKQILESLEYEMVTPHLMLFIRRYNTVSRAEMKTHIISKYLAALVVRYQGHCSGPQSVLGAAICFLSRRLVGLQEQEAWSQRQISYSGYTLDDIREAVHFVSHALSTVTRYARLHHNNLDKDKTATAFRVFSSQKYCKVSVDHCMSQKFVDTYSFLNNIPLDNC